MAGKDAAPIESRHRAHQPRPRFSKRSQKNPLDRPWRHPRTARGLAHFEAGATKSSTRKKPNVTSSTARSCAKKAGCTRGHGPPQAQRSPRARTESHAPGSARAAPRARQRPPRRHRSRHLEPPHRRSAERVQGVWRHRHRPRFLNHHPARRPRRCCRPNGAGKTTLLRMLTGDLAPTAARSASASLSIS